MSPVRGDRQFSRRRSALLVVTETLAPGAFEAGTTDTDLPADEAHPQLALTALSASLAVLISALARRRTTGQRLGRPVSVPAGARAPTSTAAVSPMPVLRTTCVLRV
ncbi:hypothetical protein [Rhodococcus sp. WAY2]|uniref:hypothetical protein n=1 Tax=Rhodococcus sp. WAY2 TaxID=2663121 RepID=UPI00135C7986|nr:hypothetical protein [Rhodococcus sp. WAY2]